jgi:YCII-related domain
MAKYVLAYRGGSMPATPAEQEAVMAAWVGWFGELGSAVVDGGNPFGPSRSVASDGSMKDGNDAGLTGYSVLTADSLAAAADLAKGCPVLTNGGSVEVYEAIDV